MHQTSKLLNVINVTESICNIHGSSKINQRNQSIGHHPIPLKQAFDYFGMRHKWLRAYLQPYGFFFLLFLLWQAASAAGAAAAAAASSSGRISLIYEQMELVVKPWQNNGYQRR